MKGRTLVNPSHHPSAGPFGAAPADSDRAPFATPAGPPGRRLLLRGFGAGAVLAGLGAGLAACGADGSGSSAAGDGATGSAGPWTYTDDRGTKVTLKKRPTRVALLTDTVTSAMWAAGVRPVAAYSSDKDTEVSVGLSIAKQKIVQLGTTDFQFKLEDLVGARPDLLIDAVQADGTLQAETQTPKVKGLAPVVGLDVYKPVDTIIGNADRLTTALGRPLADTAAKADYQAAAGRIRSAVKSNPGVRVAFVFDLGAAKIGVMNPATWSVLKTLKALGVTLVDVPDTKANTYSYGVSLEKAADVPADVLVWGVPDPLPTNAVWKKVPAVRAGQLWNPDKSYWYSYSWAVYARLFDDLADQLTKARPGTGPKGTTV
jgi:iron complex transport system substrate-binding protein